MTALTKKGLSQNSRKSNSPIIDGQLTKKDKQVLDDDPDLDKFFG